MEIGVLVGYRATIVHDGLASYDRPELARATHAQCAAHLICHLDRVAEALPRLGWATAMRQVLLDAKAASEEAALTALAAVPAGIAGPIRCRYRTTLNQVFIALPPWASTPPQAHGGWSPAEREAWNLAARMARHEDQVLRLLDGTRVPFTKQRGRAIRTDGQVARQDIGMLPQ